MGSGSFGGGTVQGAGAMAQGGDDPVVIQPDERTNSIIIHDIPKNLDQMKKLIDVLDTQTPQVMIEAKVIEASENFGKSLSGSLGIGDTATGALGSFAGGNPTDQLIGTPGVFASGSAISTLSGTNGTLAFSPNLSFLSSTLRLNAILGIGESENQVKVMASPKTVVLNRQKSSIISTTPVAIPTLAMTPGVGSTPSITISDANLGLTVTPTVTNDSSVLMDLDVSKDVPMTVTGGQGIGKRNIKTQVIVESGTTLVIGGIYTQTSDHGASGFPILRNIPVIGWLFGNELNKEERDEILIFVTPRILNAKDIFSSGGVT
jgi:type IV pilus assembly protein PilQ